MLLALVFISASATNDIGYVLRGIDNPLSQKKLAELSNDPVADLIAVANNPGEPVRVRGRALLVLAMYAVDPRVKPTLLLFTSAELAPLRLKAAKALKPLAAGDPSVVGALTVTLEDVDPFVRMQAVRSLATVPQARAVLVRHMAIESHPGVLDTLGEVLTR